ncbi:hypothetical protein COCNU_13G004350 [Cocos nucifera]|uniref:Peptidase S9 prolyl oligopeptidase catalytic domain-containing protein n=1 Tax=Cocos nucifera TaxID=13894 RepID=A0A8K0NC08_COCNU|nr:hypothetical protein COCNU_13G004350 [Cocos nucifera]
MASSMAASSVVRSPEKITAPYGSWKSPITADVVCSAEKRLGGIAVAGDGRLVWIETRPAEGGRAVLVMEPVKVEDKPLDIIPEEFAARTLAQEYGGGAFAVLENMIIFSNYKDQQLYKQIIGGRSPVPISPDYGESVVRYADGFFDPHFNRYLTVMEDHRRSCLNPITSIVAINLNDGNIQGELFFITDRKSGFWNIYKWIEHKNEVVPVYSLNAEFTRPLWVFGISSYDFVGKDGENQKIVCSYRQSGRSYLGILDHVQGSFSPLDIPFTDISNIVSASCCLYVEGASGRQPLSVAKVILDEKQSKAIEFSIIWSSSPDITKYEPYFSLPEIIEFPTENPGYGREYRERLLGHWGIVDVNDCCSSAKFLAESGKVDAQRLCITGRSAGGYTTLACLAFSDTFKAGASLYGVADLSSLKAETHKFESHYIDNLVGSENAYYERAPINFVDKFTCPVILFQGLEDKVVPPDQARKIYKALKEKGLPVALVEYEGEQHGFRKAENIKFTLEQMMMFLARLVGHFEVADAISPIKIDNFD